MNVPVTVVAVVKGKEPRRGVLVGFIYSRDCRDYSDDTDLMAVVRHDGEVLLYQYHMSRLRIEEEETP